MPYSLAQHNGKYCVVGPTGSSVPGGCHTTRSSALRHLKALYANVADATETTKADYHARAGQTIAGNLKRGNDGKFENAGASSSAAPAKKPAPKQTAAKPAAKPKKLPKSRSARARAVKPKDPAKEAKRAKREQERQLHEDQRQLDRQERQRRQQATDERLAKHEAEHEADRAQRATDRAAREAERQARLSKPEKVKPPEKPKKGGGGKGGKGKGGKDESAASSDRLDQQLSLLRRLIGRRGKSFTVFKQADGQYRWVAFSSTAYRDRDGEIVSTKALEDDCQRADASGGYGPLRWWHMPGAEIGTCDFNAMSGRVLIESGTFKTVAIGTAVQRDASNLRLSIGFVHPPDEPDVQGVFHHIRRFERSLVPANRASNLYTQLVIKETPTMLKEKIAALKALLGGDDELVQTVLNQAEATQKEADEAGVAYKAAPPPPPSLPVEEEAKAEGDVAVDTEAMDTAPEETGGPYVGDMTPDEFMTLLAQALTQALAPVVSAMDFESKMRGHMDEFKTLFSGYQSTKDDEAARQQETIAALQQQATTQEATLKETQGKLAELLGDQPRAGGYRASQDPATAVSDETRLKAAQPQADPYINTFLKEFVLGQQPAQ
jgi:hypothetical protein